MSSPPRLKQTAARGLATGSGSTAGSKASSKQTSTKKTVRDTKTGTIANPKRVGGGVSALGGGAGTSDLAEEKGPQTEDEVGEEQEEEGEGEEEEQETAGAKLLAMEQQMRAERAQHADMLARMQAQLDRLEEQGRRAAATATRISHIVPKSLIPSQGSIARSPLPLHHSLPSLGDDGGSIDEGGAGARGMGGGGQRYKLELIRPISLVYDQASSSARLEEWIDSMEMMFRQLEYDDGAHDRHMLRQLENWIDRDLRAWWAGEQVTAIAKGEPISTWAGFLLVLRGQFLPQLEIHTAVRELLAISQRAGEPMDKYFLRATKLFARTQGSFDDNAAMQMVLHNARRDEWRYTVAHATRAVELGEVTTLAGLRKLMQREALVEPGKHSAQTPADKPQQRPGGQQSKNQSKRAASVQVGEGEEPDGEGAPGGAGPIKAAPIQKLPGKSEWKCVRCHQKGHLVAQCTQSDRRTCFICQEVGHITSTCPKRAEQKKGAGGGEQSKNGQGRSEQ